MEKTVEKDLVILAQQGDEKAFETLITGTMPSLRAMLAGRYKLQPTDIDDVIQVSTIKAWKKLFTFRSESTFLTWFYVIAKHEAIDLVKKPAYNMTLEGGIEDTERLTTVQICHETAVSILECKELEVLYHQMIENVMKELSPLHSHILGMAIDGEQTYQDIAKELNISIGTVMSRLFYARKRARQLIIQYAKRYSIQLNGLGKCN